jgi:MFS transporter, ACS family, tartrate transporter
VVAPDVGDDTRRRVTRRLMPFLFVLYVVAYIDRINISFAGLQMTAELGFSDAVFGLGSGIFFVGYALLGIPGAILVEKWSARKMVATTMMVWGCVASLTGFIQTAPQFYAMRLVLGVTEAGFFPGMITYLGHWYRPQDRAKAVAMFMAAIPASQVIAAPVSAAIMKAGWFGLSGWRWLLILEGAPAVVCGIVSLLYLTDWPSEAGWLGAEQREWLIAQMDRARTVSAERVASTWTSVLRAASHRNVWLLGVAYFGGAVGNYGLGLWMPKMLQRLGGQTAAETALLTALPSIAAIPAMILWGRRSDRTGERRWHTTAPRIVAAVALALSTIEAMRVPGTLALFAIASAGLLAAYPSLWAMPGSFLAPTAAAASIGLINAFGNLGGFAGPYVIGWISSRTGGYSGGLWSLAVAVFLSGLVVLLVKLPRRAQ